MADLRKCPLDNELAKLKQFASRWFAQCTFCGCRINSRSTKKNAIKDWNSQSTHFVPKQTDHN